MTQYSIQNDIQISKNEAVGYSMAAMEECIQNCMAGFKACTQLIPHCLAMGGKHAAPEHILLLQSCAEACLTSSRFMMMGSEYHTETCRTCALICERCAEDCESMEGADERMQVCGQICRRTAQSCHKMAEQFLESSNEH